MKAAVHGRHTVASEPNEPLLFRLLRVGGQGPSADETASDSLGHSAVNVRNASDADKSNVRASSISGQIARLL
jgi:hypothetical protein